MSYCNLYLYGIYEEVLFISIVRQFHYSSPHLISLYIILKYVNSHANVSIIRDHSHTSLLKSARQNNKKKKRI